MGALQSCSVLLYQVLCACTDPAHRLTKSFCGYVDQFNFDVIPSSRKNFLILFHSKYIHMWLYCEWGTGWWMHLSPDCSCSWLLVLLGSSSNATEPFLSFGIEACSTRAAQQPNMFSPPELIKFKVSYTAFACGDFAPLAQGNKFPLFLWCISFVLLFRSTSELLEHTALTGNENHINWYCILP